MENLTENQGKILKEITKNYINIIKQRFRIDINKTIKEINKYIIISDEITEEEYKVKKYLENILENDIHILNKMNSIKDIKQYIYENIDIKVNEEFISNIITNYLNKIKCF